MRKILFLCLLFVMALLGALVAAPAGAQRFENWVESRVVCAEAESWLIEIEVSEAISAVYVFPDVRGAWVWFVGDVKTRQFWVAGENTAVFISVDVNDGVGYTADALLLEQASDCEDVPVPDDAEPMNECLGISLVEFVAMTNYEPMADGFVVDGLFYNFNETLSFLVPLDAVWRWDLYVDGRHLARFEQGEDAACHVTEVYPQ